MIQKKTTRNFLLWTASAICVALLAFACVFTGVFTKTTVAKAEGDAEAGATVATDIEKATAWFAGNESYGADATILMLSLTESDYMTAEWSIADYKWVDSLSYEDRELHNVCNAVLDKNLDSYNFEDYILIDGVALGELGDYVLKANLYTRVNTLGFEFPTNVIGRAHEIVIREGCQLPSLTHSYFGQEFSCLEIQEDIILKNRNGVWGKGYAFDGYEAGVEYDASERFFYLRPADGNYKGHTEAPASQFTDVFEKEYKWDDTGYVLASTSNTVRGAVFVAELVHPLNANEFGLLYVRVYSNIPRTLVLHNSNEVTQDTLGEDLEVFNVPQGFTTIKLMSSLYANEEGSVDTLVFEFLNEGNGEQFFITSFSCEELLITTPVYDESFFVQEKDDYYDVTFRFNKKGAFNGGEPVDFSKISLNGVTLEKINEGGGFVTAEWAAIQGIYQLNINVSKGYTGAAQFKNPDQNFSGNAMCVAQGLTFPNGDLLDRDYTCHLYSTGQFVDYELLKGYKDTNVVSVSGFIDANSANNVHLLITFDAQVTSQIYYHACEPEGWRASELPKYNLYDGTITPVFIAGGYKSALYDNIFINGKSIGDLHMEDGYTTCVLVQYGQTGLYTLDISIDSNSVTYTQMQPLFISGEDFEVEIRDGLKFTTGYKVAESVKYTLVGGEFKRSSATEEFSVFFDGKLVTEGEVIDVETVATKESVFVRGVDTFTVTISEEDGLKKFTVEMNDGQVFTFSVRENLLSLPDAEQDEKDEGCGSAMSFGLLGVFTVLTLGAAAIVKGGKKNEE